MLSALSDDAKDDHVIKYDKSIMTMCSDFTNKMIKSGKFREFICDKEISLNIIKSMFYECYISPEHINLIMNQETKYIVLISQEGRSIINFIKYHNKYNIGLNELSYLFWIIQFVIKYGVDKFIYETNNGTLHNENNSNILNNTNNMNMFRDPRNFRNTRSSGIA